MSNAVHYFGILLCCLILVRGSQSILTFEAQNSADGGWTFREGSAAIFVCKIDPYTEIQTFSYDSKPVYGCTYSECVITGDSREEFSYTNDTASGTFTWKVSPMNMDFNGKEFKCDDGNNSVKHKMEVTRGKHSGGSICYGCYCIGVVTFIMCLLLHLLLGRL